MSPCAFHHPRYMQLSACSGASVDRFVFLLVFLLGWEAFVGCHSAGFFEGRRFPGVGSKGRTLAPVSLSIETALDLSSSISSRFRAKITWYLAPNMLLRVVLCVDRRDTCSWRRTLWRRLASGARTIKAGNVSVREADACPSGGEGDSRADSWVSETWVMTELPLLEIRVRVAVSVAEILR